jgi:hypothetical protein
VKTEEFATLVALEPSWTVSVNGAEFLPTSSSQIEIVEDSLRIGRLVRKILEIQPVRTNVVRVKARARYRSQIDTLNFYAGDVLPSTDALRRRRRTFVRQLAPVLEKRFGARVVCETLHSDKQRGLSGVYPRLLVGGTHAAIAVDPDEASPVVNGVVRAAVLWAFLVKRRIVVVVPAGRGATICSRIRAIEELRRRFEWLEWDGAGLQNLRWDNQETETNVHPYVAPNVDAEVAQILDLAPDLLQAVPSIAGRAVSVRLRGLEIARVAETGISFPLGEPLGPLIEQLRAERRAGSRHPLARVHEEAWLESNLIAQIRDVLPVRRNCLYPQVPSFAGEDRKIIDILTVLDSGRLAVIEIKASADPDLPFQALDYWLAVERHRKAGDFKINGYFKGVDVKDEPAILVIVAPLLQFHRTLNRLTSLFPAEVPLIEVGVNQGWKKEIKVLRRRGPLG